MSLTRKPTPMTAGSPPETAHRPEAGFSEEQVRKRAYQIFLSRQREPGLTRKRPLSWIVVAVRP